MAVLEPYKHGYYLWKYVPSIVAAAIFCALFFVMTVLHCWRLIRARMWFCIPFVIGGYSAFPPLSVSGLRDPYQSCLLTRYLGLSTVEFVGFASRAAAHNRTGKLMPFAIQQNNILLAPVFFAATIYTTLGRVIRHTNGEKHAFIRPTRITKIFVGGDVFSLVVQGGASGLMIAGKSPKLAQAIILIGLALQIILFATFWALALVFHAHMLKDHTMQDVPVTFNWEGILRMLYVCCGLVMLRSVFRVVEFVMGTDGYLLSNEWPLYIFDAVPMLIVMVVFWRWFPIVMNQPTSWRSSVAMAHLNPLRSDAEDIPRSDKSIRSMTDQNMPSSYSHDRHI